MKIALVLVLSWLLVFLVGGCAPEKKPLPSQAATKVEEKVAETVAKSPARETFEAEWQRLAAAAKKEGNLVIYSSAGPEPRRVFSEVFSAKYGINFEQIGGAGGLLAQKLMSERRAGLYLVDIYLAGSATMVESLKPAGLLAPLESMLILPELTDPELIKKTFWGEKLHWVDAEHKILVMSLTATPMITINTDLVKAAEMQSYRELLQPRFKDRIVLGDPTIEGGPANNIAMLGSKIMGWDWVRELANQRPVITRDARLLIDWLAGGKYSVAIGAKSDILAEFIRAGAPLQYIKVRESTHLSGASANIAFMDRAPHPNAAKLFINWFVSREGQAAFSPSGFYQSTRLDVPFDHVPLERRREAGVKYYYSDDEEWLLKRPEYQKMAQDIFRPYLKP